MTTFRWGRHCAQNFSWLRLNDPRTGKRRPKPISLMRIADELGYCGVRPLERAETPVHWDNDDTTIRPPRKWQQLGGVLGVPELTGDMWELRPPLFRVRCKRLTAPWWRRFGAWLARLVGYGNPRVRPTVIGPMGGGE